MIVNVWLALRDDAQALVRERLAWDEETQGEYSGPVPDRAFRLFRLMAHWKVVQNIFRTDAGGINDWHLWNIYLNKPKDILLKVRDEIDWLLANFTNQTRMGGAWHWDSRQVGTQFVYDEVTRDVLVDDPDFVQPDPENPIEVPQITIQVTTTEIVGTSGTPTYPLHSRLLEFIPDIVEWDADGNVISSVRPTDLSDVNLLQGQKERRFG